MTLTPSTEALLWERYGGSRSPAAVPAFPDFTVVFASLTTAMRRATAAFNAFAEQANRPPPTYPPLSPSTVRLLEELYGGGR